MDKLVHDYRHGFLSLQINEPFAQNLYLIQQLFGCSSPCPRAHVAICTSQTKWKTKHRILRTRPPSSLHCCDAHSRREMEEEKRAKAESHGLGRIVFKSHPLLNCSQRKKDVSPLHLCGNSEFPGRGNMIAGGNVDWRRRRMTTQGS